MSCCTLQCSLNCPLSSTTASPPTSLSRHEYRTGYVGCVDSKVMRLVEQGRKGVCEMFILPQEVCFEHRIPPYSVLCLGVCLGFPSVLAAFFMRCTGVSSTVSAAASKSRSLPGAIPAIRQKQSCAFCALRIVYIWRGHFVASEPRLC